MNIEVSIVTPTYQRRKFIPILISIYNNQTYPKNKMEWIIVDDGRDKVEDLFLDASKTIPNIRYISRDEKMRIGAKRNLLNTEARGSIIIAMDDDDYYPADKVHNVVKLFQKYPRVNLLGSSEMYMYYTDNKKIYTIGPHHPNHSTNGTMAWRKSYSDIYKYDEYVTKAEEVSFLQNYTFPMIQMESKKAILVICHTDNTVDKMEIRDKHLTDAKEGRAKMKETNYTLNDFIGEAELKAFYNGL